MFLPIRAKRTFTRVSSNAWHYPSSYSFKSTLNSHFHFNRRMRIVPFNLKVFSFEVIDCFNFSKDFEFRERPWFSLKLKNIRPLFFRSAQFALILLPVFTHESSAHFINQVFVCRNVTVQTGLCRLTSGWPCSTRSRLILPHACGEWKVYGFLVSGAQELA